MVIRIRRAVLAVIGVAATILCLWLAREPGTMTPQSEDSEPVLSRTLMAEPPSTQAKGYFPQYRLERDEVRGEQLEILKEIINNPNTDDNSRQAAVERLLTVTGAEEREMKAENLIKARGYQDGVVILENGTANVVIYGKSGGEEQEGDLARQLASILGVDRDKIFFIYKQP